MELAGNIVARRDDEENGKCRFVRWPTASLHSSTTANTAYIEYGFVRIFGTDKSDQPHFRKRAFAVAWKCMKHIYISDLSAFCLFGAI